jgi:hypothetical protein
LPQIDNTPGWTASAQSRRPGSKNFSPAKVEVVASEHSHPAYAVERSRRRYNGQRYPGVVRENLLAFDSFGARLA